MNTSESSPALPTHFFYCHNTYLTRCSNELQIISTSEKCLKQSTVMCKILANCTMSIFRDIVINKPISPAAWQDFLHDGAFSNISN